ncbi:SDR family NAD(P)-dependent oxidoreductase [Bradyrhizobium erythrophlei]|uniref:3-oxoacyl-[acyl-carrier protein] reductase n=1 Tax=Bradyrhizobium erythrophlei TaxID=1437360 RepID=A0A1M5UPK4_9BRAD|nr:SDR family oxidoreductase [Bradyrhizobium erythrophlei]SHH64768.1 3-oxoacyl-[acyl-carrier protein] reductase [Bradyrhizobium erythrophlei]
MKLEGRFALITGASQGLGAEIARHYVTNGASVLLCARSPDKLGEQQQALAPLLAPDARVVTVVGDVGEAKDVDRIFEKLQAEFPRLDILVNNAGIYGPMGNIEDVDWDEWVDAIRINLLGLVYVSRVAVPMMRAQHYGKIINISGGGAANPMPAITAYAASKAGVVRFTESLALECKNDRIDVNAIAPGAMVTHMMDQLLEAGPEKVGQQFFDRMKKIADEGGTPLDVGAALCVFLGSSESDGITGKLIAAQWDRWEDWPKHLEELNASDVYTLRRITGRDRNKQWGDR